MSAAETNAQPSTTEVMNNTRVSAARDLRSRDADTVLLLTDTATKSKPTSAPATPATAAPKLTQLETASPTRRLNSVERNHCGSDRSDRRISAESYTQRLERYARPMALNLAGATAQNRPPT